MILGEVSNRYVLRDFYKYLQFEVDDALGDVTVIPPPPGSSYQFAAIGALVAKLGYKTRVLNMSTCRKVTIGKILEEVTGEPIYVSYAHRLAYVGPGAVINPEEVTQSSVSRVARRNVKFQVPWEKCLGGDLYHREVVQLGWLPAALERLEIWLAERFGRR